MFGNHVKRKQVLDSDHYQQGFHLGRDSSVSVLLTCSCARWDVGGIPGLHPLDVSSTPSPGGNDQKCLQTLSKVPLRGKITPSCELPAYPSVRWDLQTLCGHRTTCCWAGRPSQPVPTDNASSTPITTTPSFPSISQTPRGRSTATVRASHPPASLIRGGGAARPRSPFPLPAHTVRPAS